MGLHVGLYSVGIVGRSAHPIPPTGHSSGTDPNFRVQAVGEKHSSTKEDDMSTCPLPETSGFCACGAV